MSPHMVKLQCGTVLCSGLRATQVLWKLSLWTLPQLVPASCGGVVKAAWVAPGSGSFG